MTPASTFGPRGGGHVDLFELEFGEAKTQHLIDNDPAESDWRGFVIGKTEDGFRLINNSSFNGDSNQMPASLFSTLEAKLLALLSKL